jgi:cobalt-zinc-cadmium efflux system protein
VLAAFANGIALFAIAAWIVVEAAGRLMTPEPVQGGVMLSIAAMGLVVNIAAFWVLSRAQSDNLNVRAAALHVLGDLLGSVAAIVAGVVILWTGWTPIDPILSVVVALLILRSAFAVIRESGHILLEGAPADFDAREIASTLKAETPGVADVRHVHAWSITQERRMATLEVVLTESADPAAVRASIKAFLKERCGIGHVTVEIVEAPTTPSGSSDPSAGVRSILGC